MATVKKDALFGIIDQGIISLSNLGIGFLLIKLTSKESYGLYGIGFAAILLFVGIANALVTTQMTIFAPEKLDKLKYCSTMLAGQYIIFFPLWCVFVTLSLSAYYVELISNEILTYTLTVSITVMTAIFHEFMRRFFYIALTPFRVLQIDIVNVSIIMGCLSAAWYYQLNISHTTAIIIYGISAFTAGSVGLIISKLIPKITLIEISASIKEAWHHGLWSLGGVIVTWLQSQSYVALLSIMATTASIAEVNAAKLFLAPVGVISTSLGQVFTPRLAILRSSGEHTAITRLTLKILLLILTVIGIVVLITFLLKDYLLERFFPKDYADIGPLILWWAGVFVTQALCTNASILLQIYKRFKAMTFCNFYTALLTLFLTWLLIKSNGINGSLQAMVLGQLASALLMWRVFYVYKKR